jgi:hypothetical protein
MAMTGRPAASRAVIVADQPLESAKAPWTKAIVGVVVMRLSSVVGQAMRRVLVEVLPQVSPTASAR